MQAGYTETPTTYFYPRSPCGERPIDGTILTGTEIFLSTLSLRRATLTKQSMMLIFSYFYPRSPCGERLMFVNLRVLDGSISIHALLAESDIGTLRTVSVRKTFLSTLSLRRATLNRAPPLTCRTFLSTLSLRRATDKC